MTALERLTRQNFGALPVTCTDGAWGTELQALGAQPGELTDAWNLSAPDKVLAVAAAYVDAGAQAILTNTFSSNRVALARHGLDASAAALTRAGAEISRRAAGTRARVFGSIGPTGKLIALQTIDAATTAAAAAEQAQALADGGADAIVIETQSALEDARAALDAALAACDLPVGVTFSFDSGRQHTRTMMGVSAQQAYEMARAAGASFVGANCGVGIEATVEVARQFRACGDAVPVWIKGNAGTPVVDPDGTTRYDAPVELYARHAPALVEAGARFIGGCCGSTPAHIAALAACLRSVCGGRDAREGGRV